MSQSINLYKQLANHKLFNKTINFNLKRIKLVLEKLEVAIDNNDQKKLRELLIKAVPEFKPQCEIKDLLYTG